MNDDFRIIVPEMSGMKLWEMKDIPSPNGMEGGAAFYCGQKYVEQLMRTVHRKAYVNKEEPCLDALFSICERSLEQGVVDDGRVSWKDATHYARISWTSYFWKLPLNLKRRIVQITMEKVGKPDIHGIFKVSLKKIADDDGDIHIPPKIMSLLSLRNGDPLRIKIKFADPK